MNKYDFLSRLRSALSPLPKEERDAAMSYYEEFFSDAGEDNEQAVIASLGTPEELARSIIDENNKDNPASSTDNINDQSSGYSNSTSGFNPPPTPAQSASRWTGGQIALIVVLAVLSSPFWGGLLCVIFSIILAIFSAVIGIIAALGGCAIAFFVAGIISLFREPLVGLMLLGFSFIFIGLFPLAVYPMCKGVVALCKMCIKGIGSLIRKLTGRREAA